MPKRGTALAVALVAVTAAPITIVAAIGLSVAEFLPALVVVATLALEPFAAIAVLVSLFLTLFLTLFLRQRAFGRGWCHCAC